MIDVFYYLRFDIEYLIISSDYFEVKSVLIIYFTGYLIIKSVNYQIESTCIYVYICNCH